MKNIEKNNILMEMERNRNYYAHISRIRAFSSPKSKQKIKQEIKEQESFNMAKPSLKKHQRAERARQLELENSKIVHKLLEISRKRSNFSILDERISSTLQLQAKAREANLKQKMQLLNQRNHFIVDSRTKNSQGYILNISVQKKKTNRKLKNPTSSLSLPLIQVKSVKECYTHGQ